MTSTEIRGSYLVTRAVERANQIISEAAKELSSDLRAIEPGVPWRAIIGIGNLLRHEYDRIRAAEIIDSLSNQLPLLRPSVLRLLGRVRANPPTE